MELDSGWSISMTADIGKRVAALRGERGMTVQCLADRCRALGVPLGRVTLSKLEGGVRQAVTPAELAVLAAALAAPPIELLYPVRGCEAVEILPGRTIGPLDVPLWYAGELSLDVKGPETLLEVRDSRQSCVDVLKLLVERIPDAGTRSAAVALLSSLAETSVPVKAVQS